MRILKKMNLGLALILAMSVSVNADPGDGGAGHSGPNLSPQPIPGTDEYGVTYRDIYTAVLGCFGKENNMPAKSLFEQIHQLLGWQGEFTSGAYTKVVIPPNSILNALWGFGGESKIVKKDVPIWEPTVPRFYASLYTDEALQPGVLPSSKIKIVPNRLELSITTHRSGSFHLRSDSPFPAVKFKSIDPNGHDEFGNPPASDWYKVVKNVYIERPLGYKPITQMINMSLSPPRKTPLFINVKNYEDCLRTQIQARVQKPSSDDQGD